MPRNRLFFLIVFPLFLLVGYRSIVLDITNDEAFSFKLIDNLQQHFSISRNLMLGTANTHWLNSIFMWIENSVLGNSAWMLRIHSVFAVVFFSLAILKIFDVKEKALMLLFPFTFILCNNYLLDFFSLARGYSLSLAFEAWAIYYILYKREEKTRAIYTFLCLAVLSNYTCWYFLMSYFMYDVYVIKKQHSWLAIFSKDFIIKRWPFIPTVLWSIPNIYAIKFITHDLEEGLRRGFMRDTIGVFIDRSFTCFNYIGFYATMLAIAFGTLSFYFAFRKRIPAHWKDLFHIVFLMTLLIHGFFYLFGVPFPFGRTSFFFILPLLILLTYIVSTVLGKLPTALCAVLAVSMCILNASYCLYYRNINTTIEWSKQQGMKQVLKELYQENGTDFKNKKIAMSIDHFGVYNNYYLWLNKTSYPSGVLVYPREGYDVIPDSMQTKFPEMDYLLMHGNYQKFLNASYPIQQRRFIKRYEEMETDLWEKTK